MKHYLTATSFAGGKYEPINIFLVGTVTNIMCWILTLLGTVDEGMTAVIHDMMVLRCCGLLTKGITASQNPCKNSK